MLLQPPSIGTVERFLLSQLVEYQQCRIRTSNGTPKDAINSLPSALVGRGRVPLSQRSTYGHVHPDFRHAALLEIYVSEDGSRRCLSKLKSSFRVITGGGAPRLPFSWSLALSSAI